MCTGERYQKRNRFRAFVYPYLLFIVLISVLFISNICIQSELIKVNSNKSVLFYESANTQSIFKAIIQNRLLNQNSITLQQWIQENKLIYIDLNGDGLTDTVFVTSLLSSSSSIVEIAVFHYLLQSSEWNQKNHSCITVPADINSTKMLNILPNRYSLTPRTGIIYQFDLLSQKLVSQKKIVLTVNIE